MFSSYLPLHPDETIGVLGILLLVGAGVYAFCRWIASSPRAPDPWGYDVEEAVEEEDAVPVCPHCLSAQEHTGWFCPECGATVGQYANYLPSVYIFSVGEGARAGVEQRGRWSPLLFTGYILLAIGFFSLLAPFYCLFLFLNRARIKSLYQAPQQEESGT